MKVSSEGVTFYCKFFEKQTFPPNPRNTEVTVKKTIEQLKGQEYASCHLDTDNTLHCLGQKQRHEVPNFVSFKIRMDTAAA